MDPEQVINPRIDSPEIINLEADFVEDQENQPEPATAPLGDQWGEAFMKLFREVEELEADSPEVQAKLLEFVKTYCATVTYPTIVPYVLDANQLIDKVAVAVRKPEELIDDIFTFIMKDATYRYEECPKHPGYYKQRELAEKVRRHLLSYIVKEALSPHDTEN